MPTAEAQFPAELGQLAALLAFVEDAGRRLGLAEPALLKLLVVAEELYLNTVQHGGDQQGPVRLRLQWQDQALVLHYEDAAPEYDPFTQAPQALLDAPLSRRPVGRLGVVLVEGFARATEYARVGGRNCIRLQLAL
ncbi:MAG: ATP-binding protein [Stagnimonas sp.]|nr:ATP-binding protein [Stagnimonas sp.]